MTSRTNDSAPSAVRRTRQARASAIPIVEFHEPLFGEDDIRALFAAVTLAPGTDLTKVAKLLDLGVRHGMTRRNGNDSLPAWNKDYDVFSNIKNSAATLLDALGISADDSVGGDDILRHFAGLIRYSRAPGLVNPDRTESERADAAQAMLTLAPTLVTMTKMADHCSAQSKGHYRRVKKPNAFPPLFFSYFCLAWEAATGGLPRGRDKGMSKTPAQKVASVVRNVAGQAADRLAVVSSGSDNAASIESLRGIAKHADPTIGKAIDEAAAGHRKFRADHARAVAGGKPM